MKYKSLFISDLHIGSSHSQLDQVLEFMRESEFENLFLVGDIIDGWILKNRFKWPKKANVFFQKILRLSRKNVAVTYIQGNHDDFLSEFIGFDFGGIKIEREVIYHAINGCKFIIIHGDQFDGAVRFCPRLQKIGALFYEVSIFINYILKLFKIRWSFSNFLKQKAKSAVKFLSSYREAVVDYCKKHDAGGIILGHIHNPEISIKDGIFYYNIGDLVESGTVLVEHLDGKFELVKLNEI